MKFFLESNPYRDPILAGGAPPHMAGNGRYVAGNSGHQRILAKMGTKFTQKLPDWGVYCNWWLHMLHAVPMNARHLYRLSIHDSIDFGPGV